MKILIVNFTDVAGGAARAAKRLHTSLLTENVNAKMFVQIKESSDKDVISPKTTFKKKLVKLQAILNPIPLKKFNNIAPFSVSFSPSFNIAKKINDLSPDIVHLHWVNAGMIKVEDLLKIKAPIVWTLHDMWPFTGGCHYADTCKLYQKKCGTCLVLNSDKENDVSRKLFIRKQKVYSQIYNLTIVGLSRWLASAAKESSLFKDKDIVNLPNPIDTSVFRPLDKNKSRVFLGLEKEKKYILFGAMHATSDKRKGHMQLDSALQYLKDKNVELLIFGGTKPKELQFSGFITHYLGQISSNESLLALYNAADVMIVPSLEENLSNVIMESLSCGTPVVGFDIGGNGDLISHKENGYLAKPLNVKDLAFGIDWILQNNETAILSNFARTKVLENFDNKVVAKKYIELYKSILEKKSS
ncbi:glycosyltransferase family 4 protein [uncultured Polaribacter sp.]|uniref:glycosyltransferase family 4 protein n=1 Tax=uncultured Polaribacter sp. TaxID=174711 RepID=UPI002617545F|nr:glycosyltransferase family 4 protein [uncultured Polaribacter sp.]